MKQRCKRPPTCLASPLATLPTLGVAGREGCRSSGRERKGEGGNQWWVVETVNRNLEVRVYVLTRIFMSPFAPLAPP
jgi:hypothetical protein